MIRRSRIAAAFAVLLLACIAGVRGQEVTTVDFRADVMSSIKIADSTALCLVGHVVFFHNGAVITCDSAIRYSDRMMDCYRNVVVNKDSTFIYGDKADYNGLLNEARIYSPLIKMVDKDATLYTYNFTFNTLTNIGRYYGGGTMSQKDNLMESDEGYYYADNRELIGVRNVEMQNPQYTISSDSVTYNMDTEIATFDTPSYIWNDQDEFLTARRGSYNAKEDLYTFTDSSYIMTKTQELWADTIVYRQTGQDAVLRNNIQIADQEQKAMAFGDYGQYWGDKKQALLTRDPSVLSYEEGEQPDTVFMRSDSIFIYTLNRFRNDSVPTQKTADSLAAETPAPFPAADSAAVRPATNGPGRPPIPTLPDGQAPPPASAPAPPPVPAGNDTETPADSAQRNIPGETADSLAQSEPPVPDSVSTSDSVRKAKERPVDPKKLEKERLRKEKEEARTAKIKAKIKASREKAAAIARAQQEQEWARQRKELARRFLKGKATSEDTLALLKLDSLQQVFAADTLATSPDSTVQKAPSPAPAADSATVKAAADSAAIVDPADSLVRIVRGYYNVRIYRSDFQAVCDSIHGKPPRVGDAAPDLALADGFADHDDARAAKADEEGEGQFRKRLEDGHARVIFIAHVGVDAVERQHAEGPQSLVRHDGQRPRAELAQLLPAEREQLPHGSDEYVFLKHGKQQDQHRPQPRRDARRDRRTLHAELRQAERAEDQAVVGKRVGNGRDDRHIQRQPDALGPAQDVGQQIRQRDGRIREADDPQIPAARVQHARVLIKKSHDPCRGRQRDGQKQQRHEQREHQPQPHNAPDPLVILDAPVLRDEYAHARAQAEVQQVAQPAPLRGHADGRERHVAEPRDHHRIDQLERARQHVLQRHRQRQPRGHAPEGLIAQIISQFHRKNTPRQKYGDAAPRRYPHEVFRLVA